jgi:hypothetical protein
MLLLDLPSVLKTLIHVSVGPESDNRPAKWIMDPRALVVFVLKSKRVPFNNYGFTRYKGVEQYEQHIVLCMHKLLTHNIIFKPGLNGYHCFVVVVFFLFFLFFFYMTGQEIIFRFLCSIWCRFRLIFCVGISDPLLKITVKKMTQNWKEFTAFHLSRIKKTISINDKQFKIQVILISSNQRKKIMNNVNFKILIKF